METQKITIPENSKVSIENGVIIIESNEPKFKRGDILESTTGDGAIVIFKEMEDEIGFLSFACKHRIEFGNGWIADKFKPATEQSKQLLFDHLKSRGKRWNAEKMVVEDIPVELKEGDLAIFWDGNNEKSAFISVYPRAIYWGRIVKFESIEQYKKILKGEI